MTIHYAVVARFKSRSGIVADEVENTWSFAHGTAGNAVSFGVLTNALIDFYDTVATGAATRVAHYLSPEFDRGGTAAEWLIYERPSTPGPLGSPVFTRLWGLSPIDTTSGALPGQDALVLSFHGDLTGIPESGPADPAIPSTEAAIDQGAPTTHAGVDRLRSRARGRIFLGPCDKNACANGPNLEGRPTAAFMTDVAAAAAALALATSDTSWDWEVFSRRNWGGSTVVGGWVDNRFDTQRRRLEAATTRTAWSA